MPDLFSSVISLGISVSPEVELAEYNYNELGQLVKKNLHKTTTTRLQGVDYRYNIRGWLTSINNAKLNTDANNDDTDDAFGEELSYNNSFTAGSVTGSAQWNGNNRISRKSWGEEIKHRYFLTDIGKS